MPKKTTMSSLKVFLRTIFYLRPYGLLLVGSFASMVGYVLFSTFSLGLVLPFVDLVLGQQQAIEAVIQNAPTDPAGIPNIKLVIYSTLARFIGSREPTESLKLVCLFILVGFLVKNLFGYGQIFFNAWIEQNVIRDLRKDVFAHFQRLSLSYFHRNRIGEMVSRLTNDTMIAKDTVSVLLSFSVREPLFVLIYLVLLFVLDWKLALISISILPAIALLVTKMGSKIQKYTLRIQQKLGDLTALLSESLTNIRIVKSYCTESFEGNRTGEVIEGFRRNVIRMSWIGSLSSPVSEFLGACVAALLIWLGGRSILMASPELSPGGFMLFLGALFSMFTPLKNIGSIYGNLCRGIASASRLVEILDIEPDVPKSAHPVTLPPFAKEVRFENVWFAYEKENWVLRDISLAIPKGKTIAFVGASGAGKSTLVDLMPRFYDPAKGRITIDGINLREASPSDVRRNIAVVSQEVLLFHDTIRNNIAYGLPGTSLEDVQLAARNAYAEDFIRALPRQYDTVVGDRGVRLSGGERQRIALGRAFLRNAPILILDEATSALDNESEMAVQKAITNLLAGRTNVVIAHRLSTIRNADVIHVLDDGEIVEQGTHAELLALKGTYHRLYTLHQFSEE